LDRLIHDTEKTENNQGTRAAADRNDGRSDRKKTSRFLNLLFLIVEAVFNRDCPDKSRLKAAPTSH